MTTSEEGRVRTGEDPQASGGTGTGPTVGFVVALADLDSERAEAVAAAIRQLDGVVAVRPIAGDPSAQVVRERVDAEWRQHVVGLLDDEGV
jgi:hypothetical protein